MRRSLLLLAVGSTLLVLALLWAGRAGSRGALRGPSAPSEPALGGQVALHPGSGPQGPAAREDRRVVGGSAGAPGEASGSILPPGLHGRVVDPDGRPVVGARVERLSDPASTFSGFDLGLGSPPSVLESVVCDGEGRFRFRERREELSLLRASAPGRSTAVRGGCLPGAEVELVLGPAAVLHGRVARAEDRSPVASALVRVLHGPDLDETTEVLTDARGLYRIEGLPAGPAGLLVVPEREAMPPWADLVLVAGGEVRHDVLVEDGWTLAGQVRDAETGLPIAGAEVSCWSFLGKTVRTDAQGLYVLDGARRRPGTLVARAPGYGRAERAYSGPGAELDLELTPGRALRGRVVDPEGQPLAGMRVEAARAATVPGAGPDWNIVHSDADGRFEHLDLRDGELVLLLRGPGRAATLRPVGPAEGPELGDLVLPRAAVLGGRCVDGHGRSVEGARITLSGPVGQELPPGLDPYLGQRHATSGPGGTFRLLELAAGEWRIGCDAGGRSVSATALLAEGEVRDDLELVLSEGDSLTGIVIGPEGPLEGAIVQLGGVGESGAFAATTDGSGEFRVELPAGGPWTLLALGPAARGDLLPTWLEGLRGDGGFVEVTLRRADGWIEGQVRDGNGGPVARALVDLEVGGQRFLVTDLTGPDGGFRLPALHDREWTVHAWRTAPFEGSGGNLHAVELRIGRRLPTIVQGPDGSRAGIRPGDPVVTIELAP